jgi:hypothetical protein
MKTIRNRGKNSPVIVVINKSDQGKQDLQLDEKSKPCRQTPPIWAIGQRMFCDFAMSIIICRPVIPRFIVQSNKNLTKEKSRWRTGVNLSA